jgi:hypothetical protein
LLFSQFASAQSVLNFSRVLLDGSNNSGIAITNPSSYYAYVLLTLYGPDGNPINNNTALNPFNYVIEPKSQIQVLASDLFGVSNAEGWVQATSTTSGLMGFYFTGDFNSTLDGSESVTPMTSQVLPLIRDDQTAHTDLLLINPGTTAATVGLSFSNLRGDDVGSTSQTIPAHGIWKFHPANSIPIFGSSGTSARVTSNVPVTATAVITASDTLFVNGQAVDQAATTRVIPHFLSGSGANSQIVLFNPSTSAVNATVTLFAQNGGSVTPSKAGPSAINVTIPAHGETALTAASFMGQPVTPTVNGWVRIDSPSVPLDGLVVLDSGVFLSAIPMQSAALNRMVFSQVTDSSLYTQLDLVNTATTAGVVDITILHTNGTVLVEKQLPVAANSKISDYLSNLIPEAAGVNDGFISIRSASGIYGVEMLGGKNLQFIATVDPQGSSQDFVPKTLPALPQITAVQPGTEITPGTTIRLVTTITDPNLQVLVANLTLKPRFPSFNSAVFDVDLPANLELGYADLRIRSNGLESLPTTLHVISGPENALVPVRGSALYQKIPVTDAGLDLNSHAVAPIRNARVEVLDSASQSIISVSKTDARGSFLVDVPPQSAVSIRVLSRLRSTELQVVDFPTSRALYAISIPYDVRSNTNPVIVDRSRVSGAFNILEIIQRSNDLIHLADPTVIAPAPTMFWSPANTYTTIGTTHFSLSTNTAYILGDRSVDSDEFDDAVIAHEYGHLVAARFSRDDSPGGPHGIGELLDPRLAWSEGWANFFSAAVRNDAIYLDSRGPNGSSVYRIDVKDAHPPNDQPGYMSEATVHSLLFDLFDDKPDAGGVNVQYPFVDIWNAFTDLTNDSWVYFPYYLDNFVARHESDADTIRIMATTRSIDFQPNVQPSVTNPWPRPIAFGDSVTGYVDSLTTQREHLAASAHFFEFSLTATQMTSIRLDVTGLGPGNNPNFNDLDLFLEDMNGNVIDVYDTGGNGASKLIARKLAAGTYVVEVRSYYRRADNNVEVFNSGDYRLRVVTQSSN